LSSKQGARQFDLLLKEFEALGKVANAVTESARGATLTDAQRDARMGIGASTVNVTINGAIDPEGTARAVTKAINESASRSTGGIDYYAVRQKAG
jgi:hypothetical protein